MAIPEAVVRYFEQQKKEQQSHVNTAMVTKNLRETAVSMQGVLDKMTRRGVQVDEVQDEVGDLLASSADFLDLATQKPWYVKIWPKWWWCCVKCPRKKRG